LEEGVDVNLQLLTNIPKGRFVRIQPYKTEFIDLPDPRAILERQLANFVCLTEGDTISVKVIDKFYQFNVLEVQPKSQNNCICLIEADIEVDFAQPLDYEEMAKVPLNKNSSVKLAEEDAKEDKKFGVFKGKAVRINGTAFDPSKLVDSKKDKGKIDEEWDPRKHRITYGVRKMNAHLLSEDQFKGKGTSIVQSPITISLSGITKQISQTSSDSKKASSPTKIPQKSNMINTMEDEGSIKGKKLNEFSAKPGRTTDVVGSSLKTQSSLSNQPKSSGAPATNSNRTKK